MLVVLIPCLLNVLLRQEEKGTGNNSEAPDPDTIEADQAQKGSHFLDLSAGHLFVDLLDLGLL